MSQLAIGIIETIGLAACIEAADTCVKSANVNLIGYELSKGNGMAVLKIEGNVGAVKAAIDSAIVASNKVTGVFSSKVIARPSDCIDLLIRNNDTVGYLNESIEEEDVIEQEKIEEIEEEKQENIEQQKQDDFKDQYICENVENQNNDEEDNFEEDANCTCNICKDPNCSRQKGELRTSCIHYEESNNI